MKPLRHVDVVAVCLLLAGIAMVSQIRQSPLLAYQSARVAAFTNRTLAPILASPLTFKLCASGD